MNIRARHASWIRSLAAVAGLSYLALFAWTGRLVGAAETAFRTGRFDEAHSELSRAAFWRVRRGRVLDALGVVDLARDRPDEARLHLSAARARLMRPAAFGEERVLRGFLAKGRLEPALVYAEHRRRIHPTPALSYYLAVAEAGMNRIDDAEAHLAEATASPAHKARAERLRRTLEARRRTGRSDYLFDRRGAPLAGTELRSGRNLMLAPEIAPLIAGPREELIAAGDAGVRLSVDLDIQKAAQAALGKRRGSIVVLDVSTGAVLAAASGPPLRSRGSPPVALTRHYEPGSIIKMITLSAALRQGIDVKALFPMDCPGTILIDGVPFRDWVAHKRVESIEHAVEVSCNIAFGRLGALVGAEALDAELRRYGFGSRPDGDGRGGALRGGLHYEIGRLLAPDASHPRFALARRAEGLDSLTITPIHAALVAAGLARGGDPPSPHIVAQRVDLLGEVRDEPVARHPDPGLSPDQVDLITDCMLRAVKGPHGTARRAGVEGVEAAMKTGTSGESPPGLDGLVIGYAPARHPALAWAVVAEAAGKAEWEAARITRDLLSRIQNQLRSSSRRAPPARRS